MKTIVKLKVRNEKISKGIFRGDSTKVYHFNTQMHDPHFLQNCGTLQYDIS